MWIKVNYPFPPRLAQTVPFIILLCLTSDYFALSNARRYFTRHGRASGWEMVKEVKQTFVYIIAFDEGERILIMSFFEISPAGFTRRSRVYRRDAIRFQGLDAILGGWMDWLCGADSLDRMW